MKIITKPCYNLDVLCFLNVMTTDDFYVSRHKDGFERFYPAISDALKQKINGMVVQLGSSMISPTITLFISSLDRFTERDLIEMLNSHDEIKRSMNLSPYQHSDEEFNMYFTAFATVIVPLIKELESAGVRDYWIKNRLPLINEKCGDLNSYLERYNIYDVVAPLKKFDDADVTMYICVFTNPHGIKLCGYNMISDYTWPDKYILGTIAHEMFHPPYSRSAVAAAVEKLGKKEWVVKAFDNQDKNCRYGSMDGFIEENIVEALGIYVVTKLGVSFDPYEYFQQHDYGSHVISPYFFDYLVANPKSQAQPFEEYFIGFVESLKI